MAVGNRLVRVDVGMMIIFLVQRSKRVGSTEFSLAKTIKIESFSRGPYALY